MSGAAPVGPDSPSWDPEPSGSDSPLDYLEALSISSMSSATASSSKGMAWA
jgi:hypothetical protein